MLKCMGVFKIIECEELYKFDECEVIKVIDENGCIVFWCEVFCKVIKVKDCVNIECC